MGIASSSSKVLIDESNRHKADVFKIGTDYLDFYERTQTSYDLDIQTLREQIANSIADFDKKCVSKHPNLVEAFQILENLDKFCNLEKHVIRRLLQLLVERQRSLQLSAKSSLLAHFHHSNETAKITYRDILLNSSAAAAHCIKQFEAELKALQYFTKIAPIRVASLRRLLFRDAAATIKAAAREIVHNFTDNATISLDRLLCNGIASVSQLQPQLNNTCTHTYILYIHI